MGIFGRKKQTEEKSTAKKAEVKKSVPKPAIKPKVKAVSKKKGEPLFVQQKHILIKPLITEKVTTLNNQNQYVFEVDPRVNKIEIKNEIKKTYKVDPIKVNIVSVKGKRIRFGRTEGKKKDWKKAIIILKKGDKIEVSKAS